MKITHNEFASEFPDDWQDRTMLTLIAPFKPGQFAANIIVVQHDVGASESVEDFARAQLELLQNSLPEFDLLDFQTARVAGCAAVQQLHRFAAEQGVLQQVQTFVLHNQKVYAVTGTARVEEFNRHIAAFRQVIEKLVLS